MEKTKDMYDDSIFRDAEEYFSIGQVYDKKPAQMIQCGLCGGVEFHVARGGYFTAIRCATCRKERCIHTG